MHDDKHFDWPGQERSDEDGATAADDVEDGSVGGGAEVFRQWLSRAPSSSRRASFNPALYTMKGYRKWRNDIVGMQRDGDD